MKPKEEYVGVLFGESSVERKIIPVVSFISKGLIIDAEEIRPIKKNEDILRTALDNKDVYVYQKGKRIEVTSNGLPSHTTTCMEATKIYLGEVYETKDLSEKDVGWNMWDRFREEGHSYAVKARTGNWALLDREDIVCDPTTGAAIFKYGTFVPKNNPMPGLTNSCMYRLRAGQRPFL